MEKKPNVSNKGNNDNSKGKQRTSGGITTVTKPSSGDNITGNETASGSPTEHSGSESNTNTNSNPPNNIDGNTKPVSSSRIIVDKSTPGDSGGAGGSGGNGIRGSGDSNATPAGGSPTPKQRGRHKRECQCDGCRKRRDEKGTATPIDIRLGGNAPKDIEGAKILDFFSNPDLLTEQARKSLGAIWEGIYQIPILMGYGSYWALTTEETKTLTERTENLLKSIDPKHRKAVLEVFNKWGPVSAFLAAVMMVTYPRYVQTQMQIKMMGGNNAPRNTTDHNPGNDVNQTRGGNSEDNIGGIPQREHALANLIRA